MFFLHTVGLPSGGILSLPKMFLDPRRPEIITEQSRWVLRLRLSSAISTWWTCQLSIWKREKCTGWNHSNLAYTLYPQWRESDTVCTRIVDPHWVVHQLQSVCGESERNLHCPLRTGVHLLGESLFWEEYNNISAKLLLHRNYTLYFHRKACICFVLIYCIFTHFPFSILYDVYVVMFVHQGASWVIIYFQSWLHFHDSTV